MICWFFSKKTYTRVCYLVTLLFLLFLSKHSHALDSESIPSGVKDLRYGVVLYHFYQHAYFDAITESLIGEEKRDMPFHSDNAKLLRGGMSLSYGMGDSAKAIFNELLNTIGKEEHKSRAWFYLGKLHYLREETQAAQQAFSQVNEKTLGANYVDEYHYLKASLLLKKNQVTEANSIISNIAESSPWLSYYYFNRGAAQAVEGNWKLGVQSFELIEKSPLKNDEGRILKDRAYIALGFAHLNAKKYELAIEKFSNVRLSSPLVDQAMLGLGWASAQNQDFNKALGPWQALSKKSVLRPAVQESLLATAYAYEKLDSPASALDEYEKAGRVFKTELNHIKSAITTFSNTPIEQLMTGVSLLGADWISNEDYLPLNKQAPYLAHLIAQEHFQNAVSDYNDLRKMQQIVKQSMQTFLALNSVLEIQKKAWQKSLDNGLREKYREQYQDLLALQQRLQNIMNLAESEADGRRLLDPDDDFLWKRAEQAANRIKLLEYAEYDVSEERETLRLYQGLLIWRASENYSIKRWELNQQFDEINRLVKEVEIKLQRVESLTFDRFDVAFSKRMQEMDQRINEKNNNVNRALAQSEETIRILAINELTQQAERLTFYLGRAKLAIARLYDAGSVEVDI